MLEYLTGIKFIAYIYEKTRSFFKKDKKTEPIAKDNITIHAPKNSGTVIGKQTIGTQNNHSSQ